jgi:hypothetical protein
MSCYNPLTKGRDRQFGLARQPVLPNEGSAFAGRCGRPSLPTSFCDLRFHSYLRGLCVFLRGGHCRPVVLYIAGTWRLVAPIQSITTPLSADPGRDRCLPDS